MKTNEEREKERVIVRMSAESIENLEDENNRQCSGGYSHGVKVMIRRISFGHFDRTDTQCPDVRLIQSITHLLVRLR
jgi:hypothetical protein